MTINKSQGQTFKNIGIFFKWPVFTHGQLYVAASRVWSLDGLRFYISEYNGQGHLANDEKVFTKNIVYREVLNLQLSYWNMYVKFNGQFFLMACFFVSIKNI